MNNWTEEKIIDLCNILGGKPAPKEEKAFDKDGIPFVRMKDLGRYHLTTNLLLTDDKINESFANKNNLNTIPKGAILLPRSGSVGLNHRAILGQDSIIVSHICALVVKDDSKISNRFLYYWLCRYDMNQIAKKTTGLDAINFSDLGNIIVSYPELETQNKIVTILDKVHTLLEKREKTIAMYDELLRATFWQMFNKYEGENISFLSEVADITSGLTKGKDYTNKNSVYVPYMRVANVQDGYLDLSEVKEIEATAEEISRYNLQDDDLLLTEGGDPDKLGRGALWGNQIEGCIFQNHIFRVRIKEGEKLNPVFLSYQTSSLYGKTYFLKSAKQTTGIASINSTQLKNFPVYLPPQNLQNRFARIVSKVNLIKLGLGLSLDSIKALNNSISQLAFKGELNFNTAVDLELLLENDYFFFKTNSSIQAIQLLIDRLDKDELNNKKFYESSIYDKAKSFVFELLKEGKVQQVFDERTKSVKLTVA